MQVVHAFGAGEGFWGGLYNFFDDNIWGEALLKVGTGAGSTALNTFIQGQLGPPRSATGQMVYAPYNTLPTTLPPPVVPGNAPAPWTEAESGSGLLGIPGYPSGFEQTAPNYTPWILAGAGALLLVAVLS